MTIDHDTVREDLISLIAKETGARAADISGGTVLATVPKLDSVKAQRVAVALTDRYRSGDYLDVVRLSATVDEIASVIAGG